ncbi:RHS repeat domain-containing protein [Micromonospora sp. WMMD1219]|uniref:RHS repeat domain-containing protein n=1 Tax=Micromonospora sp. WMMD1219 TaxID=3404115 RepID=UPI003BF49BE1
MPTETSADGTVVDYDSNGRPVRQQLPDGTVFDRFNADGKPTHVTLPGDQEVTISYGGDGSSTWTYGDGTRVQRDADGDVTRQVTADGAVFDRFTADGKPEHGTVPGVDGQPAQDVSISYGGDGSSTWSYGDGTRVQRDVDGDVSRQVTADGAVFDRFDGEGRPTHGTTPGVDGQPTQDVTISYGGDGSSTWTYGDGTRVQRDADGDVTRQVTAEGAVFDRFDGDGKPSHGTIPGAGGQPTQDVSISYGGDGSSTWSYGDGTRVQRDADGDVTRQVTAEGAVFDRFTADGKPEHGTTPGVDGQPAQDVTISYGGDGSSTWSYGDGTRVQRDADGDVTRQVTAEGAVFDRFDGDGKPSHGTIPGAGGQPAQDVSISYGGDGSSTWSYGDGTRVQRDADGDVTRQVTAEGAVFDRFTADGKPEHGTTPGVDGQPAQDVTISYGGDGSSTWTYGDGTRVQRDVDGDVSRQVTADGAVFDRFDGEGRPTHGTTPGVDGQPTQDVSISYGGDGSSTWTYGDGTTVQRNADGDVTRQVTADGAVFDRFTADGKPEHGRIPGVDGQPAQDVTISYGGDGSSTWTYGDGTRVQRDADGDVTRQVTAEGAVFDRFTADGKPSHGTIPGVDGQPAQDVSITYGGDGGSTWTYTDGTRVQRDADGDVTRQVTAEGAVFDRFDGDGKPSHGTIPGAGGQPTQDVSISYGGDGSSTWSYGDGTRVQRDADGDVSRQVTAEGAVFDRFTADGKPEHGRIPGVDGQPAQDVTISYGGDGSSTWTYGDGTRVQRDADGDVSRQVTADGAVFDRFDGEGRPTHGTTPGVDGQPAQDVTISYGGDGSSTWTYGDGTTVQRNADGDITRQVTADGAVFDRFDGEGRPTQGTTPGVDGQPAQDVTISYGGDGSSTWTYGDGTRVQRDVDGDITRQVTADGAVFDRFDGEGRPTHGTTPGVDGQPTQDVTISYGGDGSSTWTYGDGTTVQRDADGDVTRQVTAEGAVFDRFTADGKPEHGTTPGVDGQPAQDVTISYGGDGSSTWTYGDGTRVQRDVDGDITRQVTADGAVFDRFTADGKPEHGRIPGVDGQPVQDVSISYGGDGSSTWSYGDGTRVQRDADGDVSRQVTAEGAVFDRFTADGKPSHGTIPGVDGQPVQDVSISYGGDGSSTWTYGDGTRVQRDADGDVTRQVTADGAVFDRFDGEGRPTHGTTLGVDGQPAQDVTISYGGDGSSTWTYGDGTTVQRNADGDVTRQVTADGAVFDRFDGEGRPTHGTTPGVDGQPTQEVTISYGGNGSSTWTYADGTKVDRNPDGAVVRQVTPEGVVYDAFNADGRPIHGTIPGRDGGSAQQVDIVYHADGSSVWDYQGDGTKVYRNAEGDVTRQELKDGTVFDRFDENGNPTHGTVPAGKSGEPAQQVNITYAPDGSSAWKYGDGTTIRRDPAGTVTGMQAGGWTFDRFDDQGRPTHGTEDGKNNAVDIKYSDDGSSVWTYQDGATVNRNADGDVVLMQANGWIYDAFDDQGRPTRGTKDGQTVTIAYGADGLTTMMYDPKNGLVTDSKGNPVAVIVDGKRYDYAVQIALLGESISKVRTQRDSIGSNLEAMASHLGLIRDAWNSPAGAKYEQLSTDLKKLTTDTSSLLDDAIRAMQKSYDNYVAAEGANVKSMLAERRMKKLLPHERMKLLPDEREKLL